MGPATPPGVPIASGTHGSGGMGLATPPGVAMGPATPPGVAMGPATPPGVPMGPATPPGVPIAPGTPRERRYGSGHAPLGCRWPQAPPGAAAWARPLGTAILNFSTGGYATRSPAPSLLPAQSTFEIIYIMLPRAEILFKYLKDNRCCCVLHSRE
ncbi:hypothetical protein QTO34_005522 [Cnephaeus nilssonii]|uniref:Uncharacterized protein n=1 Tax=Cnephaeus nilssonii TaxID=3371016 RepID=A0AA40LI78_CNENI|nr:hypothetical protein QTO34_005522 [Eptesicus nilssonii]